MTWHGGVTIVGRQLNVGNVESLIGVTGHVKRTRSGEQVWHWSGVDSGEDINASLREILSPIERVATQFSKITLEHGFRAWVTMGWDKDEAPELVIEPDLLAICGAAGLELSFDFPMWRD